MLSTLEDDIKINYWLKNHTMRILIGKYDEKRILSYSWKKSGDKERNENQTLRQRATLQTCFTILRFGQGNDNIQHFRLGNRGNFQFRPKKKIIRFRWRIFSNHQWLHVHQGLTYIYDFDVRLLISLMSRIIDWEIIIIISTTPPYHEVYE